ncbi:MAG: hypothetical protein AABY07_00385 [Nanoarchaeota archaeon]
MKQEIAEKWADALESGKYQQGKGGLHKDNQFCCLGVLCDIFSRENNKRWISDDISPFNSILGKDDILPSKVKRWAGMKSATGILKSNDLVTYNDAPQQVKKRKDFNFKDIAGLIRRNWKKL